MGVWRQTVAGAGCDAPAQSPDLREERTDADAGAALARRPPLSVADGDDVLPGAARSRRGDADGDLPRRGPRHPPAEASRGRADAHAGLVRQVRQEMNS